jgi:hypothetical protein
VGAVTLFATNPDGENVNCWPPRVQIAVLTCGA